jgi:O-antigen/teichoic acid export membrane protein
MGLNFLVGIFIAAISGTALFGIISLMVVNAAVFAIITGLGTDSAIVWHGASKQLSKEKVFSFTIFSLVFQLVLFVIISFIYYRVSHKLLLSQQDNFGFYFYELIYFSGLILIDKYTSLFYASQRTEECNRILASVTLLCLVLILFLRYGILNMGLPFFSLVCFTTFLQAITLVIFFHRSNAWLKIVGFSQDDLRSIVHFSIIVFISNLLQFFAYRADYWVINYFRTHSELGIYSQANRFAQLLWILPNIFAAMLIPLIASPATDFKQRDIMRLVRAINFFNILVIVAIVLIALFMYHFFLPEKFSNGFLPLLFMIPGYYFFSINILLAAFFSSKRLLWINFIGSAICFVVIIMADLILIPRLGIKGAAFADSIAYIAAAIYSIVSFTKLSGFSFAGFFTFNTTDWKYILAYKESDQ